MGKINFKNKDLISILDLSKGEILYLCNRGKEMYDMEKNRKRYELSLTAKKKLAYLFYEASTRTRTSFITAIEELGGLAVGFAGIEGTSIMKKETIRDTVMMYWANHSDIIAMRHPLDGSVQWAADVAGIPVINGGDGKNEHPTQSLLDLLTMYLNNGENLDRITLGLGGDLAHGRTIRSLTLALSHFDDITIKWSADDFFGMPKDLEELLNQRNVKVIREDKAEDVLKSSDFYYMTRPQTERMKNVPMEKVMEMIEKARITKEKLAGSKAKLLHPLPVNSEIAEITYDAYFTDNQLFFFQAECGPFIRKRIVFEFLNNEEYVLFEGKLNPALEYGNNRLKRASSGKLTQGKFIDDIANGTVLDHLEPCAAQKICSELKILDKGYFAFTADCRGKKSFMKTNIMNVTERDLKRISFISADPTVNYVKDGIVADKFVYLLCKNISCITREIIEDVPPKFYNDNGTVRCRYCRRPYEITNPKVTPEEKKRYMNSLPKEIEKI
jgi:aspartate carbamoyltransferase catalytic subunit